MPIISFIEENKATFVFLALIFIAIFLTALVIILKLPPIFERPIIFVATWMVIGSVAYYIIEGVRSMWVDPEAESWEWVLYFGLFLAIIFSFALLLMGYKPIDITQVFG